MATARCASPPPTRRPGVWHVDFIGRALAEVRTGHAADMTDVDAAVEADRAVADHDLRDRGKPTVPVGSAARLQEVAGGVALRATVDLAGPAVSARGARGGTPRARTAWCGRGARTTLAGPPRRAERAETALREAVRVVAGRGHAVDRDLLPDGGAWPRWAASSFLGDELSFINALSEITETVGGDIRTLVDAIGLDDRIGRSLNAWVGFGGGACPLPRRRPAPQAGPGPGPVPAVPGRGGRHDLRRRTPCSWPLSGAADRCTARGRRARPLFNPVRRRPGLPRPGHRCPPALHQSACTSTAPGQRQRHQRSPPQAWTRWTLPSPVRRWHLLLTEWRVGTWTGACWVHWWSPSRSSIGTTYKSRRLADARVAVPGAGRQG
ncbi:hypothetical protein QJS66_03330 [Kocuria rhizophila]|nr:hypothetical protein QJS66_03330 [Kocuria rhizophila]